MFCCRPTECDPELCRFCFLTSIEWALYQAAAYCSFTRMNRIQILYINEGPLHNFLIFFLIYIYTKKKCGYDLGAP